MKKAKNFWIPKWPNFSIDLSQNTLYLQNYEGKCVFDKTLNLKINEYVFDNRRQTNKHYNKTQFKYQVKTERKDTCFVIATKQKAI